MTVQHAFSASDQQLILREPRFAGTAVILEHNIRHPVKEKLPKRPNVEPNLV